MVNSGSAMTLLPHNEQLVDHTDQLAILHIDLIATDLLARSPYEQKHMCAPRR